MICNFDLQSLSKFNMEWYDSVKESISNIMLMMTVNIRGILMHGSSSELKYLEKY